MKIELKSGNSVEIKTCKLKNGSLAQTKLLVFETIEPREFAIILLKPEGKWMLGSVVHKNNKPSSLCPYCDPDDESYCEISDSAEEIGRRLIEHPSVRIAAATHLKPRSF